MPMRFLICLGFAGTLFFGLLEAECRHRPQNACDEFFNLPAKEQQTEFRKFPAEKQLALYRCGMNLHPKTIGLAYLIADGGVNTIPILIEAIKNENDESVRADLIYILEVFADRGDLKGRQDVAMQLQRAISAMHGTSRERAEESLAKISQGIDR